MKHILFVLIICFATNGCRAEGDSKSFYGSWVIKQKITSGPVSAYGEDEAQSLVGKELFYSPTSASFDHVSKIKPFYEKTYLSADQFREKYLIDLKRVGIDSKSVLEVDVYADPQKNNFWDSVGNVVFVKDRGELVLFSGGVFFRLTK